MSCDTPMALASDVTVATRTPAVAVDVSSSGTPTFETVAPTLYFLMTGAPPESMYPRFMIGPFAGISEACPARPTAASARIADLVVM